MQGWKRRLAYVGLFEVLAIGISSTVLGLMSGASAGHSLALSVMISTTAMSLNFVYNIAFEAWEARQKNRQRSVGRRVVHAVGFQISLLTVLIPMIAWWFEVSLIEALVMDLALIVFFPIFTFVFAWGFDQCFGLPAAVS